MTTPEPPEPTSNRSEVLTFAKWVLSSWQRVLRVVVLISAPIVGILIFTAIAVTVILYLKVDPQRWGAVLGLGVITAGVAKAVTYVRNRLTNRRPSPPAELSPSGKQEVASPDGESGATGEGDGDNEMRG